MRTDSDERGCSTYRGYLTMSTCLHSQHAYENYWAFEFIYLGSDENEQCDPDAATDRSLEGLPNKRGEADFIATDR